MVDCGHRSAFLESDLSQSTARKAKTMFNAMAKWEQETQSDCTTISIDEMQSYLPEIDGLFRYEVLHELLFSLKAYMMYCHRRNLVKVNTDFLLNSRIEDFDLTENMRRYAVDESGLERLCQQCDSGNGDIIPVTAILLWLGFAGEEIAELNNDDVIGVGEYVRVKNTVCANKKFASQLLTYKDCNTRQVQRRHLNTLCVSNEPQFIKKFGRSEGRMKWLNIQWKYNDERESKTFYVPSCHDVAYLAQLESVRKLQQENGGESIHLIRAVFGVDSYRVYERDRLLTYNCYIKTYFGG